MNFKALVAISMVVLLSACASNTPIQENTVTLPENNLMVCKIPFDVPQINPVEWQPFEWKVLTQETVEEEISQGNEIYYIGLTYDDYTALSLTINDILRYSKTQNAVIEEMETYYSNSEE